MDITIPYHPGLLLGHSVNMKSIQPGYMLIGKDVSPIASQLNKTTHQFSFADSLKDVCDVLSIPPEYALKVKSGIIANKVVEACFKNLGAKDSFTVIFRTCFLKQKHYLHRDAVSVKPGKLSAENRDKEERPSTTESLIADAAADIKSMSVQHGTHWVKEVEYGNELIIVMRISTEDEEKLTKLRYRMCESLKSFRDLTDEGKLEALQKTATDIDKELSKNHYEDVHLEIMYGCFQKLPKYPANMTGMLKTLVTFTDQYGGWTEASKQGSALETESCVMMLQDGIDTNGKTSIQHALLKRFQSWRVHVGLFGAQSASHHSSKESHAQHDDHDSLVVLDSTGSKPFYTLRVKLQSFEGGNEQDAERSFSSLALSQLREATYTMFERLFKARFNCVEAEERIQTFLSSKRFLLENRIEESNAVLKQIQQVHFSVLEAVNNLDFVCLPSEETLEDLLSTNALETVNNYIETVTSKLPPGSDLDLLMIGKTGHGKSATGNSILGEMSFVSSSSGESVTTKTNVAWSEIDGRIIKVVDTPGVYDTKCDTERATIDLAIHSFSDAIANCPEGFHALLLIIRYGSRMTTEEKNAIRLLTHVLGEDIVKTHCICVITHGDNFESEMARAGKKATTFSEWYKAQSGFLKWLFEECNYRCVLFNNMATDPKAKKAQLIQLIAKVDELKDSGIRYTNELLKFAQRERRRIVSEERVPQVNEHTVRDIKLSLDCLRTMVNNTNEQDMHKKEFPKLRERVGNLNSIMSDVKDEQQGSLVNTVYGLAATINAKMDETAGCLESDRPENPEGADGGAGAETAIAQRGESPGGNDAFKRHLEELQCYYDHEVSPKVSMVNQKVTEQVKIEVGKKSCFPGSSKVMLESGRYITLEELQIGDMVLVRDEAGHIAYDAVYMFGHQDFEANKEFIVLSTAYDNVFVTKDHFVICTRDGKELLIAAEYVSKGDCLLIASTQGFIPQPVENITHQTMIGMFAPFTHSGTVVVDNALMSCYIDVLKPTTCHTLLWPVRQIARISPRALAFINGSPAQHPVPRWAKAALKLM